MTLHLSNKTGLTMVKQVWTALSLLVQNLHEDQGINKTQRMKLVMHKLISKATHRESLAFTLIQVNVSQSEVLHLLE